MEDQSKKSVLKSMPMLFLTDDDIETSSENIPPKESASTSNVEKPSPSSGKKRPVAAVETSSGENPLSCGVKRNKSLAIKLYVQKVPTQCAETKSASVAQKDTKRPLETASTSNIVKPPPSGGACGIRRIKTASKSYLQKPVPPLPASTQIKESVNAPHVAPQPVRMRDKESAARRLVGPPISMYSSRKTTKESNYAQSPITSIPMTLQARRAASMCYTQRPVCISSAISHMMESAATAYAQQQTIPPTGPMPAKEIAGAYYVQRQLVPPPSLMSSKQLGNRNPVPRFFLPPAAGMRILPRTPFIPRPMVPPQMQTRLQAVTPYVHKPILQPAAAMPSKESVGVSNTQKIFVPLSANTLTKPSTTACFVKRPVLPTFVTTHTKESNMSYVQIPAPSSNAAQISMPCPQKPIVVTQSNESENVPRVSKSIIPEATLMQSHVPVSSSLVQKQNIPPSTTSKPKSTASTSSAALQAKPIATAVYVPKSSVPLPVPVTTQTNIPTIASFVFKPFASSSATTQSKMLSATSHIQKVKISPSTKTQLILSGNLSCVQKSNLLLTGTTQTDVSASTTVAHKTAVPSTTISQSKIPAGSFNVQKHTIPTSATLQARETMNTSHVEKQKESANIPRLKKRIGPKCAMLKWMPTTLSEAQKEIVTSFATIQPKGAGSMPCVQTPAVPPESATLQTKNPRSTFHLQKSIFPSCAATTTTTTTTPFVQGPIFPPSASTLTRELKIIPHLLRRTIPSSGTTQTKGKTNLYYVKRLLVPSSIMTSKKLHRSTPNVQTPMTTSSATALAEDSVNVGVVQKPSVPSSNVAQTKELKPIASTKENMTRASSSNLQKPLAKEFASGSCEGKPIIPLSTVSQNNESTKTPVTPLTTFIKQEILSPPEKGPILTKESTSLPVKEEPADPSSDKKENKKTVIRNFIVKTTISKSDLNKLKEFVRECSARKKAKLASTNKDTKVSDQKPDEQKPDKQKPDEQKPDKLKPDEQKPDKQISDEQEPDKQISDELKPDKQKPDELKPAEQKPDKQRPKKPSSMKTRMKCYILNPSQQKELTERSPMLKYLVELTNCKDKETALKYKPNDNFQIVTPEKENKDVASKSKIKKMPSCPRKNKELSLKCKLYKDIGSSGISKRKYLTSRRFNRYRDKRLSSGTSEKETKRSLQKQIAASKKQSSKKSAVIPFYRTPIIHDGHGIKNENQGNLASGIFKPGNYEFPLREKKLTIKKEITISKSKSYDGYFSTIPNSALHKRIKLNLKSHRFFYATSPLSNVQWNKLPFPEPAHLATLFREPTNFWTDIPPQNMPRNKPMIGTLSFSDLKTHFIEKSKIVVPIMTGKCTTDERGNKVLPSQDPTLRRSCTVSRSLVYKNMKPDKNAIKSNPLYLGRYRSQFPPLASSQKSSKHRQVCHLNTVIEEPEDLSHKRKKLRLGKYKNQEKIIKLSKEYQKTFSVCRSEMPKGISLKRRPSNSDDESSCSYSPEEKQELLWEHQYKTGCLDEMNLVPKEKLITGKVLKQMEKFQSVLLSHDIQHKLSEHRVKKEPDERFAEQAMDDFTNHELNKVKKMVNKRSVHIPRYDPSKDQYLPTLEILGMYEGTSRAEDVMCTVPECRVNQYGPELNTLFDLLKTEKPRRRRPLRKYKRKVETSEQEKTESVKTEKLDPSIVVKQEPLSPKEPPKNKASFKDLFGVDEEEFNTDSDENIKDSIFNLKSIPPNIMNISPIPRKRKSNDAQSVPGNGTPIPGIVYPKPEPNIQIEYPIKNPMPNIDPEKTPMLAMRPLVADARVIPEIQNIITTCNLGCSLDLKFIAYHTVNSEYDPNSFSPVIIRIRQPRTTALIFASGVMVCTGATSEYDAKIAARKHARIIQKLGFDVKFLGYKIMNILARCELSYRLRLEALAVFHYKFCTYEPELFPGLIYYMEKPEVMLMIYPTGKIYLKGAKSRGFVNDAFNNILPVLKMFKKNTY